ncbi:MAG TPA: hypothetical protein VMN36_06595 [Verrucomicrobiales bacterium]|nr:hypothetical protein [Verrucomicrobiales bacterium]
MKRIVSFGQPFRRKGSAGKSKKSWMSIVVASVAAHVVLGMLLAWYVVSESRPPPEAVFEVAAPIRIPPDPKRHRMSMARQAAVAAAPPVREAMASTRKVEFALPESVGKLDTEPPPMFAEGLSAALGALASGAAGSGLGKGGGKGAGESGGFSFFNIQDEASSVLIMIDVSASMFGRTGDYDYNSRKLLRQGKEQAFQGVREEAFRLIDALNLHTRFGVVHWSGSARSWKDALAPGSAANRAEAKQHIQRSVDCNKAPPSGGRPGGTRHDYALEEAFRLGPEVVFLLTDGNATRSLEGGGFEAIPNEELFDLVETLGKESGRMPRIHTIYYVTGQDKDEEEKLLRGLSRKTDGQFRKVKAPKKGE